jgi:glycosyltransferase involved in cell wall biosynthesis
MYISIIIPTYGNWDLLIKCIEALDSQSYSKDEFEVIIINNHPEDTIPSNIELPKNFVFIEEKKPSSYAARNTGLKIAKGEIIGFTDSDCIPNIDWISKAVDYLTNHSNCSRIAGRVALFYRSNNLTIAEKYEMLYAFDQKKYAKYGTSATANMFTYKHVFEEVGYFEERLKSGGDYLWGTIAQKAGFNIDFVDNVIVGHPARHSLADLIIKEKRIGIGQAFFLDAGGNKFQNFKKLLKVLMPKLWEMKFIIKNGKSLSFYDQVRIFFIRHLLLYVRGYTKYKNENKKNDT